jgi:hypothetical protein
MAYESAVDAMRSGVPGGSGFGGAGWRVVGRWADMVPETTIIFGGVEGFRYVPRVEGG